MLLPIEQEKVPTMTKTCKVCGEKQGHEGRGEWTCPDCVELESLAPDIISELHDQREAIDSAIVAVRDGDLEEAWRHLKTTRVYMRNVENVVVNEHARREGHDQPVEKDVTPPPMVKAEQDRDEALAIVDELLDYMLSNRGTEHEFYTCKTGVDVEECEPIQKAKRLLRSAED